MRKYWVDALISLFFMPMVATGSGYGASVDYAQGTHREAWLHHPVLGDPSFDTFTRLAGNPLHRGRPPLEWPVNGFLFEDPRSGNWYVYVGEYSAGYAMGPGKGMGCIVYRSVDKGRTWERLGGIFPDEPFTFQGDTDPVGYAPDVSVVFDGGKYHLVYDYLTRGAAWDTLTDPKPGQSNGVGYAWAEKPEGPFHRTSMPVYRVGDRPWLNGNKYRRFYAATIVRRAHDWLVLGMMDSDQNFSWALAGMTAKNPEGPYSELKIVRCVDDEYYHPELLEFFPAFTHKGYIYAPATSVALNRNFQALFRVKIEEAMRPEAWELAQEGSVWHAADTENEYYGIWGQTFSGQVMSDGKLRAMYPARDRKGMGTINLAERPWDQPYRKEGFILSGHQGASLSLIDKSYDAFKLDADVSLRGKGAIVWGWRAPLGPDHTRFDSTLNTLTLSRHRALEMEGGAWKIIQADDRGTTSVLAEGKLEGSSFQNQKILKVELEQGSDGQTALSFGGKQAWSGKLSSVEGPIGILVDKDSHLEVKQFEMKGKPSHGHFMWLATEAILGGGAAYKFWDLVKDPDFRYGEGAISIKPEARGKWNVHGSSFALWSPRGPRYGQGELFVDGRKVADIDVHADQNQRSSVVWKQKGLTSGPHSITFRAKSGVVPLDVLEVGF